MYYDTLSQFKIICVIVNIAIGQLTFQSTTAERWYDHDGESSKAVDGNKNTAYCKGSCTHTLEDNNPWWAVDLLWSHLVGEVHLTNRGDCCGELGLI